MSVISSLLDFRLQSRFKNETKPCKIFAREILVGIATEIRVGTYFIDIQEVPLIFFLCGTSYRYIFTFLNYNKFFIN